MSASSPIIVALDFPSADQALVLVNRLDPALCRLKIGNEMFTRAGPALVEKLITQGFEVFLDLKYHDIPNTVAAACAAAADLGVWMVNIHASGGRRMMEAARKAVESAPTRPLLIGVTVLTSMADEDLLESGVNHGSQNQVLRLATLAKDSGLDGVVCSAQEASTLKNALGQSFKLVTPGIRPANAERGDQRRTLTPGEAVIAGSDYLVIGRPITQAPDPLTALEAIVAELAVR